MMNEETFITEAENLKNGIIGLCSHMLSTQGTVPASLFCWHPKIDNFVAALLIRYGPDMDTAMPKVKMMLDAIQSSCFGIFHQSDSGNCQCGHCDEHKSLIYISLNHRGGFCKAWAYEVVGNPGEGFRIGEGQETEPLEYSILFPSKGQS